MFNSFLFMTLFFSLNLFAAGGSGVGSGTTGVHCISQKGKEVVLLVDFLEKPESFYTLYNRYFSDLWILKRKNTPFIEDRLDKTYIKLTLTKLLFTGKKEGWQSESEREDTEFQKSLKFLTDGDSKLYRRMSFQVHELIEQMRFSDSKYITGDIGDDIIKEGVRYLEHLSQAKCSLTQIYRFTYLRDYLGIRRLKSYISWDSFKYLTDKEIHGVFLHEIIYLSLLGKVQDASVVRSITRKIINRDESGIRLFYKIYKTNE